ncbi:MAG: PAS domain S-box protein [Rhizobacter sp.]|nr:PAS domain S-box protein [Ferruginibacter sp.]
MNHFKGGKKEPAFQSKVSATVSGILAPATNNGLEKEGTYMSHLAAIVESSHDAIISKSLDGIILSWNSGSERMFGYTVKQALGKPIAMLIPPECFNEEKNILERIHNNEVIDYFETVRLNKKGDQVHVSLTISPLKDGEGKIIGISKIAKDITLRRRAEAAALLVAKQLGFQNQEREKRAAELIIANKELAYQNKEKEKRAAELIMANKELLLQNDRKDKRAAELIIANNELAFQNVEKEKRAAELIIAYNDLKASEEKIIEVNKELESFSYSVSHDLRAPLRAIIGYTKMLKATLETELDPEPARLMNNIVQNATKMGLLIDDLLTFSRIGRRELVQITIPMHSLVQNICDELKEEVPDRNIEFRISNLLPALADNMALKQVWLNLVSNSIKYTRLKNAAIIEISSETAGEEVTYCIKDNGAGFDMRYANKLFGVFQRLHSEEEFEGTGVGLALVQRIISKHGGRTWAEAKVNEGATFYFTLHKP